MEPLLKAVSIVGFKKTGKSTLAVLLAEELKKQGYTIAAVKHSVHGFDKEGTDTAQLSEHCESVVGISGEETFISWPGGKRQITDLLPLMRADVLLMEGGKNRGWLPRILCTTNTPEKDRAALKPHLSIGETNMEELRSPKAAQVVSDLARRILEKGFILPGLDCGECGMPDCEAMSSAIVAGTHNPGDCQARKTQVEVSVNGSILAMGGFVEDIVASTIRGLLSQLKGYTPGEIRIRLPKE